MDIAEAQREVREVYRSGAMGGLVSGALWLASAAAGTWGSKNAAVLVLIFGGFLILSYSWHVLWKAQRRHKLATTGIYARMRHPQYASFISIMLGFLLQWPTLPTAVMFPILTYMYLRLALREETDIEAEFGDEYRRWATVTPRFIPRLSVPGAVTKTQSP